MKAFRRLLPKINLLVLGDNIFFLWHLRQSIVHTRIDSSDTPPAPIPVLSLLFGRTKLNKFKRKCLSNHQVDASQLFVYFKQDKLCENIYNSLWLVLNRRNCYAYVCPNGLSISHNFPHHIRLSYFHSVYGSGYLCVLLFRPKLHIRLA